MENSREHQGNPEIDVDKIIKESLRLQLQKMQALVRQARTDTKFKVLAAFIEELETESFTEAFAKLSEAQKHAILTRLENETEHTGGKIPYDFVKKLEQSLYGVVVDEDNEERIDFSRKINLEKQVQEEN